MKTIIVAALASAGVLSIPVATAANDDTDIENIIVTASRTDASIDAVGSSISVITDEEIRRRGAITLANLLRDMPGLAVNQAGPTGSLAQVRMRGAEANQILVLIDGIEANDLAQGNEFNFAHIMASDIERIEIVRGPQSALWGSDALAGVINIITRPRSPATRARGSVETGSFGTTHASLGADYKAAAGSFSLGASHITSDGTNISRTGNEDDGYDNTTLRAGGRLTISDNTQLTALARHTDSTIDFDGVDSVNTGLPVDAPNETDSTQAYAKLRLATQLTDAVEQIVALHYTDTDNTNRSGDPVDDVTRGTRQSVQSQTNIDFGPQVLSLLVEHEQDDYEQRGLATSFGDPNKDLETERTSVAAELRHDGERFNLSASLRHERNSEFEDANTWRLTGLWKATDSTGLFASWGRSIKNPTFTERFGFFDTFTGNPELEPEHSRAWELGLRHRAGERVQLSASYFESRLVDEINGFVFDAASGGFTAENVDGESDRRGVEVDASWQATDTISVDASYTWLDATEPSANGELEEIRRPGDTASLRANFDLARVNVNIGAQYNGSQLDTFFPPFPEPSQRVTLDAYTLVDAAVRYQLSDAITLHARVENALDETYEEVFGFRSPGFGAYAGVEVKW